MLFAFFSALSNIWAIIINKKVLTKDQMDNKAFNIWLFVFLFIFSFCLTPWFFQVDWLEALRPITALTFAIMLILAVSWNDLYYRSLKNESMAEFQLMSVMQPLFTICFSMIIFADERNLKLLIVTIIAGLTLIVSHLDNWQKEKHSFTLPLLLAIVLASLETLFIKELLLVFSPIALYSIRTGIIALIYYFSYYHATKATSGQISKTAVVALLGVAVMVCSYYAYDQIGVARTTLITLFYPIGATILSVYLLGEKIQKRKILALLIIIICIIFSLKP